MAGKQPETMALALIRVASGAERGMVDTPRQTAAHRTPSRHLLGGENGKRCRHLLILKSSYSNGASIAYALSDNVSHFAQVFMRVCAVSGTHYGYEVCLPSTYTHDSCNR